jgi:hypothetical protein
MAEPMPVPETPGMTLRQILDLWKARYPAFRDTLPLALDTRNRQDELAAVAGITTPQVQKALHVWTIGSRPHSLERLGQ